jgi:N-acetylglutamate synthase/N-acetylornithine aminotransferase
MWRLQHLIGLHRCLPAANGSGRSPVRVLATYKAAVQPAQRIEFWVDGKKLFQEYGDLLKVSVPLAAGAHQLSVVGVDATGKYVKSNITYTVTP